MSNPYMSYIYVVGVTDPVSFAPEFFERFHGIAPVAAELRELNDAGEHEVSGCLSSSRPHEKYGMSVPVFKIELHCVPEDRLQQVSKVFPDLTFCVSWSDHFGGSYGDFVVKNGMTLEYVSDRYATIFDTLTIQGAAPRFLAQHMPLTLAQRGASQVDDALHSITRLHEILHDYLESRFSPYRDQAATAKHIQVVDQLLMHLQEAAKILTFDGVFLGKNSLDYSAVESKTATPAA